MATKKKGKAANKKKKLKSDEPAEDKVARGKIVSGAEFCKFVGCDPATMSGWYNSGFPVLRKGKVGLPNQIDSHAGVRWMIDREKGDGSKLFVERTRVTTAQRVKLERENLAADGILVPIELVKQVMSKVFSIFKTEIQGAANRLAKGDAEARIELLNEAKTLTDRIAQETSAEFS